MTLPVLNVSLKRQLRRIPGLVTTYRHAHILATAAYERWWADRQRMNDRSILRGEWDFEAPAEQERYQRVLAAVTQLRGPASWGDVLEIGCAEGLFTAQLVQRSGSVTAHDVSPVACERTARKFPDVRVQCLNIERDPIPGAFDVVFVMGVLGYVHGRRRLGRVTAKLAGALRTGGLLVFNELRLHEPQTEACWWARWLPEGGLQLMKFLDGRHALRLAYQDLHPKYVIGIYEKTLHISPRGWKRLVPSKARKAYRAGRVGMELCRELDVSSWSACRESWKASAIAWRVREDSLISPAWLKGLHRFVRLADREGLRGDFVECGVYRGGSAAVLADGLRHSTSGRHLWLFDSFQGLPTPTCADGPSAVALAGDLVGDQDHVARLLRKVGAPLDRVHIRAGWFDETFLRTCINRVALLHIDADWYESIKLCLEHFYDRLEPGAIVVLDDYHDWPGCKAAVEDFAASRGFRLSVQGGGDMPPYFRKKG